MNVETVYTKRIYKQKKTACILINLINLNCKTSASYPAFTGWLTLMNPTQCYIHSLLKAASLAHDLADSSLSSYWRTGQRSFLPLCLTQSILSLSPASRVAFSQNPKSVYVSVWTHCVLKILSIQYRRKRFRAHHWNDKPVYNQQLPWCLGFYSSKETAA